MQCLMILSLRKAVLYIFKKNDNQRLPSTRELSSLGTIRGVNKKIEDVLVNTDYDGPSQDRVLFVKHLV